MTLSLPLARHAHDEDLNPEVHANVTMTIILATFIQFASQRRQLHKDIRQEGGYSSRHVNHPHLSIVVFTSVAAIMDARLLLHSPLGACSLRRLDAPVSWPPAVNYQRSKSAPATP